MGRKNTLNTYITPTQAIPIPLAPNVSPSVSLATSFNTISTSTINTDNIAYHINIITTNSTGQFNLQCSADNVNWVTVGAAAIVGAANDVAAVWVNQEYCSSYVRLAYVAGTAGTGTCTMILTTKQGGA